jgi:hypothetical protein
MPSKLIENLQPDHDNKNEKTHQQVKETVPAQKLPENDVIKSAHHHITVRCSVDGDK